MNSGTPEGYHFPVPLVAPVTQVTYPMINHEEGKDGVVITTNGTYPWS